jgi:hypothetical protein
VNNAIGKLTLYVIEHEKMIKRNKELIEEQETRLNEIRESVKQLSKRIN